jgi:hypothetical protein
MRSLQNACSQIAQYLPAVLRTWVLATVAWPHACILWGHTPNKVPSPQPSSRMDCDPAGYTGVILSMRMSHPRAAPQICLRNSVS